VAFAERARVRRRLFAKQLEEMQLPSAAYDYDATDLSHVRKHAASRRRCPLWRNATQTVFGEGPAPVAMMLVGEQPGDKELSLVCPSLTVALGATAASARMRRPVSIGRVRGQAIESESGALGITVHPSYRLRLPHETSRQREFVRFVKDLEGAKGWLASHRKRAI
jgi:uracil-DNA glycosylase